MNRRAATTQGLLALAGLIAAYFTWQREPSLDNGQAYILDITKGELQSIRYEELEPVAKPEADDKNAKPKDAPAPAEPKVRDWVELTSTKEDAGRAVWMRLAGKEGSNVALPSGHPMVQTAVPERLVRGNESAEKMWDLFSPFSASRALGKLDAEKVKDLGLDQPKKRLKVTFKGVTKTFTLAPAPPGGTDPYVRDDEDGMVYIVARQILSDFQAARTNMTQRKLHGFIMADVDKVVITASGKKKEFQFRRFDGRPGGELLPASAPDKPDQTAGNWHERVFALFPAEVLGKGEKPAAGEPKVVVRIEYLYRNKLVGWLDLGRSGGEAGTAGAAPSPVQTFARSEFTAGWMTLSPDAQNLVSEGETTFGAP
ncbi:MAG: DUF4340 domain-containing protein [Deltaproteobacteria bacterium]|nr:DUF4340 domain-containing protein [Deltaproteobacteria bacterium]